MNGRARTSRIKAAILLPVFVVWCIFAALVLMVAKTLHLRRVSEAFPQVVHRLLCRLFSLQCDYVGKPTSDSPTLYVANHISYLDVFVLGKAIRGSFVAKSEVASWPVFGTLAKLGNTLFLERKTHRAAAQIAMVRSYFSQGRNLIMFPEGTSTAGRHVVPFRSSLFAAAENLTIQPVTIAYVDYEGEPMSQRERDQYAWYLPDPKSPVPNRPFASHLVAALGLGRCTVKVLFHEPFIMSPGARKQCALQCESTVRRGLEQLLGLAANDSENSEIAAST